MQSTHKSNKYHKQQHSSREIIIKFILFQILFVFSNPQCLANYQFYNYVVPDCQPCAYNCMTCFDSSLCTQCVNQYYLDNNNNVCLKCPFGCSVCSDSSTCVTCNTGLYIDANGNCLSCSVGVASCSIAVVQSCQSQYFLLGDICAGCFSNCQICQDFVTCSQCSVGYYLSSNSQSCLACSSNCQVCTDSVTCTYCSVGYTISSNECVVQDCSAFPYCTKCTSTQCLNCQQGKYLSSGSCQQGGSILCFESTGPYFTNCYTSDYGCPVYANVQTDSSNNQMSVCLPKSATQYKQYIYNSLSSTSLTNCVSSSCQLSYYQQIMLSPRQAYYQITYYLNMRFYSSSTHNFVISVYNNITNAILGSSSQTIDISLELSTFNQIESGCSGCSYGQLYVKGVLSTNGYQDTYLNISDQNGHFTIMESVFQFSICKVQNCQTCTTSIDCLACISPYYLQLVACVESCDAGFYLNGRECVLTCPTQTYSVQSSYQCQACISPCKTCISSTQCSSCVSGYYLQQSSCVTTCSTNQLFGNSTSNACQACPNPCSTCQAVNETYVICLSCQVGYLLQNQSCTFICPTGLYISFLNQISQCSNCNASCSDCYIESTICTACNTNYLLYGDETCTFTNICQAGYFINTTINSCIACQFPCSTCQSSQTLCTSCLKGALFNSQCLILCPSQYYISYTDINNITCQACINNCLTCVSDTVCTSCNSGLYLYSGQCLSSCPNQTFFQQPLNNTCQSCIPPCLQCSSSTSCLSCATGYLDVTSCTLQCNSTSYVNSNFVCTLCVSPCSSCYSSTQCLQCDLPYVFLSTNSSCISKSVCQGLSNYVYYHIDSTTNLADYAECKSCTYPCASCNESSIVCLSCSTGYLFLNDLSTCLSNCPTSYYQSTGACLLCNSNCLNCISSSTNCTQCSSGMYLDSSNVCVSDCGTGYYNNNQLGICSVCVSPCFDCYNAYLCKSCLSGILYNKACIDSCPEGTILNSTSNTCDTCTNNCLTCQTSKSNCTSCISGYYLFSSNNSCISTCPTGYYAEYYTKQCTLCISPCLQCTSSVSCTTCVASYYFLSSDNSCLSVCSDGYYQDQIAFTCNSCNSTICLTCVNDSNTCLSCAIANNYYLDSITYTPGKCVLTCPTSTYSDIVSGTCKQCTYPCIQCTNTSYCTACQTSYKLYLNQCYSACPVSYYSSATNQCVPCSSLCQICNSGTNCQKCQSPYYVQTGSCVLSCNIGYYKGLSDLTNYDTCMTCQSDCVNCTEYSTCVQCISGLFLFNGICMSSCPILYYQDTTTKTCQMCSLYCQKCINSTYCQSCLNSYIYQNSCYVNCPAQTYVFNDQSCQPCVSPCLQCTSQYTCLTCITNYLYYHEYCVTSCPSDVWYYPNNNSCNSQCPYHKYTAKMICYINGCGGKMVSYGGYCLDNCPSDMYVDLNQNCISCSQNQNICSQLFIGQLQILRSDSLTLSIYFSQQTQIVSLSQIDISFTSIVNNYSSVNLTLTSYQITQYSITLVYSYDQLTFVNTQVTLPYLQSKQSSQSINNNKFTETVYYFNDYEPQKSNTILPMIGMGICAIVFFVILVNVIVKTSYFLQLLDFMQLIAATLYLQIQYPIELQKFLHSLNNINFSFMPQVIQHVPYAFSPSKFIYYNTDTSLTRCHMLTFLVFLIIFLIFVVILAINQKYPEKFFKAVKRIRYRHLNDLFSIFIFPLLLFSFSFSDATVIDIFLGVVVVLLALGFIILISYKIINVKQLGDLQGLLSDLEPVSSKLGLMYTPFAFIRKFIVAFVFCTFPQKPLATLTLLLVFTILILICLCFYQPFYSQITDYVSIFMQCMIVLHIFCLVLIGLDLLPQIGNSSIAMVTIIGVCLGMFIGLGWLIYLTGNGTANYCKGKSNLHDNQDQQAVVNKNNRQQNQINPSKQPEHQQNQNSANQLISNNKMLIEDIYSNSNKEEFRHWNEDDQQQEQKQQNDATNMNNNGGGLFGGILGGLNVNKQKINKEDKAPKLLMKKKINQENQNKQIQNSIQLNNFMNIQQQNVKQKASEKKEQQPKFNIQESEQSQKPKSHQKDYQQDELSKNKIQECDKSQKQSYQLEQQMKKQIQQDERQEQQEDRQDEIENQRLQRELQGQEVQNQST